MGKEGIEEGTKSEERRPASPPSKKYTLEDFMVKAPLGRTTKGYVREYLQKKIGLTGTESQYKAALDEFLNKEQ